MFTVLCSQEKGNLKSFLWCEQTSVNKGQKSYGSRKSETNRGPDTGIYNRRIRQKIYNYKPDRAAKDSTRGGRGFIAKPLKIKPSAYESEIHPLHRQKFVQWISFCEARLRCPKALSERPRRGAYFLTYPLPERIKYEQWET